ncbi:hypothetical protein ACFL6I_14415 [candidate division KSB1 bacterium]
MIIIGGVFYPEAAQTLKHYIYGDGRDLEIGTSHIRKSPVIREFIKNKGSGTYGPIGFEVVKDKRLAYFLNPFYIKIMDNRENIDYEIYYKYFQFPSLEKKNILVPFIIGKFVVRIPDNLIYSLKKDQNLRPFNVYARWKENK